MATERWFPGDRPQTIPPTDKSAATKLEPQSTSAVWRQQHANANATAVLHAGGTTNTADGDAATFHATTTDGTAAIRGSHDAGVPHKFHGRTALFLTVRGGFFV